MPGMVLAPKDTMMNNPTSPCSCGIYIKKQSAAAVQGRERRNEIEIEKYPKGEITFSCESGKSNFLIMVAFTLELKGNPF